MIQITNKKCCSGYTACDSICLKEYIKIKADEEGFLYPVVDTEKYVRCDTCNKVCTIQNPIKEQKEQKAYLVQHKDEHVRVRDKFYGCKYSIMSVIKDGR